MKIPELKIVPTLTLSVGFLVLLAAGLVLYVQWNASRKITTDLAGRVCIRNLEIMTQGIERVRSYTRFSGAWTHLAFLAFFALTAAHFRSRRQWRRAALAIGAGVGGCRRRDDRIPAATG